MSHGNKDYFTSMSADYLYGSIDLAELAARLGAIAGIDRKGNVIWFDSFEAGAAQWNLYAVGPSSSIGLSTQKSLSGGYSVALTPGSNADNYAVIDRYHYLPPFCKWGFECSVNASFYLSKFIFRVDVYEEAYTSMYAIQIDDVNYEVLYRDETGDFTPFASFFRLQHGVPFWSRIKFVIDPTAEEYVMCKINNKEFSMKGLKAYRGVASLPERLYIAIVLYNQAGHAVTHYIDNVIMTINEY